VPKVLITGANRGIGLELARQYVADGWDVIACCRNPKDAEDLQSLAGSSLRLCPLDVTDHQAITALADELRDEPIDVLINNAGIIGPVPVAENIELQHFGTIDYSVWERVIRINTFGPVKMAEAFLPHVLAGKQKKIVNVSSTVGSITERDTAAFAYATSKTALNKAMTLLASQLKEQGVAVALVCPGYVKTRMDFGTADVEIPDSAKGIRSIVEKLTLAESGSFTRYNGEKISW